MKLKCDMWRVTSDEKNNASRSALAAPKRSEGGHSCHPSPVTRHARGVALIITLILLAVVTFMALTFLAVSRRERNAVTTTTDTTSAQLAADDALASAEGQIVANMLANTNPYNFGLLVSTNYINASGFTRGVASPTNVNFDYYNNGPGPLLQQDFLQNLANLYYLPRTPVVMSNLLTQAMENRFYLDLNRNGYFETNGMVVDNGGTETNLEVGDPEWVGVLQHPDQPYGPNNPFVARYAFVAVPIGNVLDLNTIYNQAITRTVRPNSADTATTDGFLRNQGVGPWEINLAAFLTDLNTYKWDPITDAYNYREVQAPNNFNVGAGFEDALSILSYRYAYNYNTLAPAGGPNGLLTRFLAFPPLRANIDYYSDGPLMTTPAGINVGAQIVILPWSGADNTNHFFDLQELYDPNKTSPAFVNRLQSIGDTFNLNNSDPTNFYNRYTYYRLLSQMGVESAPEQNNLNLNYSNALARFDRNGMVTNIAIIPNAETNFTPWAPLQFFTIAADKMLRAYSQEWLAESPSNYLATYGSFTNISTAVNPVLNPTNMPMPFGITNIPVYVNGQFVYTPAVQRVLQLAANIYDATTNNSTQTTPDYPSVFRPIFEHDRFGNLFIVGYTNISSAFGLNTVNGMADPQLALPYDVDARYVTNFPPNVPITDANGYINVYGVPWIIGAKKGFPNFNEFSMQGVVQVTRKLELTRPTLTALPSEITTNQMYIFSISNVCGVECWNSYSGNYTTVQPNGVQIAAQDYLSIALTNDYLNNNIVFNGYNPSYSQVNSTNFTFWPGTSQPWARNPSPNFPISNSFVIPLFTNVIMFTNLTYVYRDNRFEDTTNFPDTGIRPLPPFGLLTTNRLRVVMLDGNHVIDYVQFAGPDSSRNLNAELADVDPTGLKGLWNTNLTGTVPFGVNNQINYSDNPIQNQASALTPNDDNTWVNPQGGGTAGEAIAGFDSFIDQVVNGSLRGIGTDPNTHITYYATNLNLTVQVPFTPTRTVFTYTTWQANDPLVHYTASDLNYFGPDYNGVQTGTNQWNKTSSSFPILPDLGQLNKRYQPWGINLQVVGTDPNPYNVTVKDPLVYSSDDWDFPAYKLPAVGWLSRVHRGTPWQTVYLKSPDILSNNIGTSTWSTWTGDSLLANGQPYDAANTAPRQDRLLFDLFTTAPNDNATLGQLSVNVGASDPRNPQAGLAAWSALFAGVQVLTNTVIDGGLRNGMLYFPRPSWPFTNAPIDPAGPAGLNSPLGQMVAAINRTRANFVNPDGLTGTFEHAGDILAVPQLTVQSPFLNHDPNQQTNGINDELYEWLPQQVMSLLHVSDSPRYVIYSYGQTLKPAPNGINTLGGAFFGMVTNYQVVAEAATRAVVRFNGTRVDVLSNDVDNASWIVMPLVTNNTAVIEQFNVLPSN